MSTPTTITVSGQRLRRCWDCEKWKALPEFYRDRSDGEGRKRICAACDLRRAKAFRAENLDDVRRRDRERKRALRIAAIERFLAATISPTNPED